ncbi:kinesin light chain [Halenospora varia]|nr:kinesin light chain [Halenospora varia]
MRLLEYNDKGEFSLAEFFGDEVPRYAILSHRWGAEEVTLADLMDGNGKKMAGYSKIQFCGEQSKRDGLQYFWVDTCCIDKSNSTEVAEAINSMFRWYQNATKCYVYLSDVSRRPFDTDDKSNAPWESRFRKSRWFTRGWTLQELIAPVSLGFFSEEGELLGDKAESRETTCKEDRAYSLLGIFDVNMPLIYGEGKEKALKRLREEIDKASKGIKREDFSVAFSLSNVSDVEHFVAREAELVEMHRTLSGDGSRRTVVLHGLGGIGKTQLSVAYTKRHKDSYSAIFWLNIKDEDSLKQSFTRIAKQILREHPLASRLSNIDTNESLDEVVDAVKAWLSLPNNRRWLMIYDNYNNPKLPGNTDPGAVDIRKFLPESYQGSILITTRSSQVRFGHTIQIRKLGDVGDSLEILSNTSRRERLIDDPDAIKLAKELDGLPLALATAGAYLDQAYFDSQDLWLELLQHSDSNDPDWVQQLAKDELSFHNTVRVLSNHGFVEVDMSSQELIESQGYSMHGCVHLWTVHVLNQSWDYDLAKLAVKFVGSHIQGEKTVRPWLIQRRLLQHANRSSYLFLTRLVTDARMAWACHNLGNLYKIHGKLVEAEQMYQQALQGYKKAWGIEHTSTLDTVNNLRSLYADQGKLVEAEQMYQRALQGYEKA